MAVSTTSTTAATAPAVPTPALGPPHAPSRLGVPAGSSPPPFTLTSSRVTSSPPRVSPPLNLNGTSTCHLRSSLSPHPPSPPRVSSRGGPCNTREVRSDEFRQHTRPVRFMEETFACPIPLTCPTRCSRGCGIDSRRGLIPLPAAAFLPRLARVAPNSSIKLYRRYGISYSKTVAAQASAHQL